MSTASKNAKKTRGRPFEPGNKHGRGRPEGSRNRASIALQTLLDGESQAITRKAIQMAKAGDTTAMRLCLERLLPTVKDRTLCIDLPIVKSSEDVWNALGRVLQAVSAGEITPAEGQTITGLLEAHRRTAETVALEARITELERKVEDGQRQS
jgi:hypothetical protein